MNIREVIGTLNAMQAEGVIERYAIGGAIGATFYLEPLDTFDVDVFVRFPAQPGSLLVSLQPIFDDLARRGFAMEGEYFVVGGWPVQFLPPTGPLVEEALAEAATRDLGEMQAQVFTAEHLAAIALQTGRAKDKARLLQFIEEGTLDSTRFEEMVERHGLAGRWQRFAQQFLSDSP